MRHVDNTPVGWKHRKGFQTHTEFITSSYAEQMRRRMDYYTKNQFVHSPENLSAGEVNPGTWNASWSGYGWADLIAMLPDMIEESIVYPTGIPFVTTVVDNLQVVYAVPVRKRQLIKGKVPEDANNELLEKIYEQCDFDAKADQLCKWTGLFDTCFQYTAYDKRRKKFVRRNLPPYMVFVAPSSEDPTDIQHPDCFVAIAQLGQGMTKTAHERVVWECWYQDKWWYEDTIGREFRDALLSEEGVNINPYIDEEGNSIKPIQVTHSTRFDGIYKQGSDMLVFQNQRLDRDITAISSTMEYQGFAVPVVTGATTEEVESQPWSQGALFHLQDAEARLEFAHPAAPIGETLGAFVKKARMFARLWGIDPELVDPAVTVQSGVSRAQARKALMERREEEGPRWKRYEREAYWLMAIMWNVHNDTESALISIPRYVDPTVKDEDIFNLSVEYGEYENAVDPLADILTITKMIDANVLTRSEYLQSRRKISKYAADDLAKHIKEENDKDMPERETFGALLKKTAPKKAKEDRIGQPGNRPQNEDRAASRTGGNTTASSGNAPILDK